MLFIATTSYDTTIDLLIHRMGAEGVFRYNSDLWRDYRVAFDCDGFRIEDPTGRVATEAGITKVLWYKPARMRDIFPEQALHGAERYREEEMWYVLREIINLLWSRGKVVLVEPYVDLRVGKFVQARLAADLFHMPAHAFTFRQPPQQSGRPRVVKSLTSEPIEQGARHRVLYTTEVDPAELSPDEPWLVQDRVDASHDVTVAYVRDRAFAFALDRNAFGDRTIDWRELAVEDTSDRWQPHALPADIARGLDTFMARAGLHFGRFDFLLGPQGYSFLEINPSGLWGWLDPTGVHGLLDKVVAEVSPKTPCHPIPVPRAP